MTIPHRHASGASLLDVLGGLAYVGSESRLFPHTGHTPGYKWGVEVV